MANNDRLYMVYAKPPYFDAFYFSHENLASEYVYPNCSFMKIVIPVDGTADYYLGDNTHFTVSAGDMVILPRNMKEICRFKDPSRFRRYLVWFTVDIYKLVDQTGEIMQSIEKAQNLHGMLFESNKYDLRLVTELAHLLSDEFSIEKRHSEAMTQSAIQMFLIALARLIDSRHIAVSEDIKAEALVYSIIKYINDHLFEDLSLDSVADACFMSKYHLERVFKKQTGTSVHNFIIQRRVWEAKQRLYSGASPTAIAKECGFSDYSSFYRAFRKIYRVSPKAFAENYLANGPGDSYA